MKALLLTLLLAGCATTHPVSVSTAPDALGVTRWLAMSPTERHIVTFAMVRGIYQGAPPGSDIESAAGLLGSEHLEDLIGLITLQAQKAHQAHADFDVWKLMVQAVAHIADGHDQNDSRHSGTDL